MKSFFKVLAAAGLILGAVIGGSANAQQATPVQQSASRLDAGGAFVFAPTPSINQAQTTITIPAASGLCAYIDSLLVSVGMDATGTTGVQTFTTTNLGGLAYSFFPVVIATSPSAPYFGQQLVGSTPLKAASCGVATTIVSPAQATHNAYAMAVYGHYAP
jgi:hypothetical protein